MALFGLFRDKISCEDAYICYVTYLMKHVSGTFINQFNNFFENLQIEFIPADPNEPPDTFTIFFHVLFWESIETSRENYKITNLQIEKVKSKFDESLRISSSTVNNNYFNQINNYLVKLSLGYKESFMLKKNPFINSTHIFLRFLENNNVFQNSVSTNPLILMPLSDITTLSIAYLLKDWQNFCNQYNII